MTFHKDVGFAFFGSGVMWTGLLLALLGEANIPLAVIALTCTLVFSGAIAAVWDKISPKVILLFWVAAVAVVSVLVVPVSPDPIGAAVAVALGSFFFAAWLGVGAVLVQVLRGGLPLPRD